MSSQGIETLGTDAAEGIARSIRGLPDPLRSQNIPPSLLSAEHIRQYVLATGLIAPFVEGGEKPRLKKAAYEGRVGDHAYEYNNGALEPVDLSTGALRVRANSIVFVECDLQFRLPEYIALRFNLQIRHVHRGLLLGTGPLVDPGFWGRLCIPLHNLTSKDYSIPKNEGLIWIEFTKTTSNLSDHDKPIGADPGTTNTWDIRQMILKASQRFDLSGSDPIQSSIAVSVRGALDTAENAHRASRASLETADRAESTAEQATKSIGQLTKYAVVAAVVSLVALLGSFLGITIAQTNLFNGYINATRTDLAAVRSQVDALNGTDAKNTTRLDALDRVSAELSEAQRRLSAIEAKLSTVSPSQ